MQKLSQTTQMNQDNNHQDKKNVDFLIWIDLEMTGLNPEQDRIIEIATVITDSQLNIIAEGPNLVISQKPALIEGMDEWNQKHHGQSGLIDKVLKSTLTEQEAQKQTIDFLKNHVSPQTSPMCGNTICQDRRFLARYMPELEAYFHYRQIDVSTIKELAKRWAPTLFKAYKKETAHRALDDIHQSIQELQYYQDCFFKVSELS